MKPEYRVRRAVKHATEKAEKLQARIEAAKPQTAIMQALAKQVDNRVPHLSWLGPRTRKNSASKMNTSGHLPEHIKALADNVAFEEAKKLQNLAVAETMSDTEAN